ncbi:MAG: pyrroline-5-carboxylate reductase [Hyphomicrobium sp.]|nr:pyrroline-5-carboxylate reductase [Hyphomicrobium sp.]
MSFILQGPLLLAGVGKMGGAVLSGLLARGLRSERILVQDPAPSAEMAALLAKHGIRCAPAIDALGEPPSIILLAVKPQMMDEALAPLAKHAGPDTLVLSIAAGRSLQSIEAQLPERTSVIRAMPNTPAAIGRGITVAAPNLHVSPAQRKFADELLSSLGKVLWVEDESLLDPVTAVSGSGPAYVFLLVECLAEAGQAAGLDAELAEDLARATVTGSAALLDQTDLHVSKLREHVTSPGGTTAAALAILNGPEGLRPLLKAAVAEATKRGRDLAK